MEEVLHRVQSGFPETVIAGDLGVVVYADPEWLGNSLDRVVENAFRHGRPPVRVEVLRQGDAALISVEDEGSGVPPEFVPQLFETFTQADTGIRRRTSGVGLGLAVVAEVVSAMRGDVWYETGSAGGARICLRMPLGD